LRRRIEHLSGTAVGPTALLHRACFPEDPWDTGAVAQVMGIPGFFGHIAWQEETPVGFALALNLCGEVEILSLGVLREHRRTGVGRALLQAVCLDAGERGARSVVLEVAINNVAARVLYAGHGFVIVGRRQNYYREAGCFIGGLILRRELAIGSRGLELVPPEGCFFAS
jgi:[ribosomal protein S18]-alanine N-acetyltransferase